MCDPDYSVRRTSNLANRIQNSLGGECLVVHEEKVNIVDVVDEESLVARRHQVAGFLVGAVPNLRI